MWIGHSSTHDEPRVYRLARVLMALRHNLHCLKDYYTKSNSSNIPAFDISLPHPRNYPYLKSFIDSKTSKTLRFKYVRALENDARCVTYQAKILSSADSLDANTSTDNDAPTDIVVKFVSRYGKDVHEFLARDNHAPDLRYFGAPLVQDKEDILGDGGEPSTEAPNSLSPEQSSLALPLCPMKMVVMDYISPHAKPWPRNAREQVSNVLHKLHDGGYVSGDLRPPNVLFD
ncbi:hypothetical protein BDQ12DRAFT_473206 [Crucibulum laeve]|uniref:Protein kinase domain-containing protein n=1 Tax=Crucibulum laeve TaxID=68775 RepID=A0A5C3LJH9_9AGAR|nr:hypothetical protein BDQ12DRAFT_473206 [Crucibulum laeve]